MAGKKEKIQVYRQKTFTEQSPEKLDTKVNEWLMERCKAKKLPPMPAQPFTTPQGEIGVIYCYADLEESETT